MNRVLSILRRPQVWGFFVSVAILAVISLAFFYPDNFDGASLRQADMQQGAANGEEARAWEEATGEKALWTNSLFGGMPTFQISPSYPSNSLFNWLDTVYGLGLPAPSNLLFMMMFGFLILLFALRLRWYYALIGAVGWGFSSYFIIIIGAGHIWKFLALTYVPPTIAGLILLYRDRYLSGGAIMGLFTMMQLKANHPQMTYYFGLLMVLIALAYLVSALRHGRLRSWGIASGVALVCGLLGVGANLPSLYNTYEYAKETKRSQSELAVAPDPDAVNPADPFAAKAPTGGMPYREIVGWSYGRTETLSLLIPNIKGGATARPEAGQQTYMSLDKLPAAENVSSAGKILLPYLPQYFNNSEGTNGPVYVGAIFVALFILGLWVVKGPLKWALLCGTVSSILLAWGANLEWLTDMMVYHFPLYNKFRAVESILVVAEFCIPLLGILALARILEGKVPAEQWLRPALWSFGGCALLCVVLALVPSFCGEAITEADYDSNEQILGQVLQMARNQGLSDQEASQVLYGYSLSNPANVEAIRTLRYGMLSADAWRSAIFLILGGGVLLLFGARKLRPAYAAAAVGVLVLVDLYPVDKRYVSHSSFCTPEQSSASAFTPDALDKAILADTTAHYRVMDIPGFDSPNRSYFHHMTGGYHAAKLNRYQDLINEHINTVRSYGYMPELRDDSIAALYSPQEQEIIAELRSHYRVLDMLNTRYIITGNPAEPLIENPYAMGNAWLVEKVDYTENARAEMDALGSIRDLRAQAVADVSFAPTLGREACVYSPGDTIRLTAYSPNTLDYSVDTRQGGIAVFSEVYFPWGWKATIDGQSAPLARVNYILRALRVPAGHHSVSMTFAPDSLRVTGTLAYACVTIIYLLVLAAAAAACRRWLA